MTGIDYRAHIERCLTNSGMQPYGAADLLEGLTRQIRDGYPAEAETHQRADDAEAKLAEVRATNQRLNLRCQQAESKLATYERAVGEWELSERGTYIPLRTLAAIAKVVGREFDAQRFVPHYQRVETAEAKLAAIRQWAQAFGPTDVIELLDAPTAAPREG